MSLRPRRRTVAALTGRWQRLGVGALVLWLALAGGWAAAHRAAHALHGPATSVALAHDHAAHDAGAFGGHAAGSDECRWLDHLGSGEGAVPITWLPPNADRATPVPAACPAGRALPAPGAFQARAPPVGVGPSAASRT